MARRKQRVESPVETAEIRDLTLQGQGVAETGGKTAFVAGALTGEEVTFRRARRHRNYDEADLIEVLRPSPDRVMPACEYFLYCGGCALQHVAAPAQLHAKQAALLQALRRIGDVEPEMILPPLAGEPLGYRRRARLGVRYVAKKGRVLVGFRERQKPYIADMRDCKTLAPRVAALIQPLSALIEALSIRTDVPQIEISLGDGSLSLVVRVLRSPSPADAVQLQAFADEHDADIWLQTGGPQTLEPLAAGSDPQLWYDLPDFDVRLRFGPLDFIQVNQDMNRRMIVQALTLLGDLSGQRVLDLFCGIGNFSLPLARRAAAVVGVELDPGMVEKATDNARANAITNAEFYAADLSDAVTAPAWWGGGFDVVVLDPPRAGALECLAQVAATGAPRILYVSCHPGSLARDAGVLVREHGYRLKSAGAMDMFPQTSHVEAMALFERPGSAADRQER